MEGFKLLQEASQDQGDAPPLKIVSSLSDDMPFMTPEIISEFDTEAPKLNLKKLGQLVQQ